MALRERIFDPFFRRESAARGTHGLGLAFCAHTIARHGGTVRAGDVEGGSARFVIAIPRAD